MAVIRGARTRRVHGGEQLLALPLSPYCLSSPACLQTTATPLVSTCPPVTLSIPPGLNLLSFCRGRDKAWGPWDMREGKGYIGRDDDAAKAWKARLRAVMRAFCTELT